MLSDGITTPAPQVASDLLLRHWRDGTTLAALPEPLRPADRASAYRIQALIEPSSARTLFGWKIAATSAAGQRHINVDGPIAGRIIAERVVPEGEPVPLGGNRMRVAEVEFVFRMGASLSPRATPFSTAEVMAAVAGLHLGIEVPDSRYEDFTAVGAAQLIADAACADRFVLGPEVAVDWRAEDLAAHVVEGRNAAGLVHRGRGSEALGDPRTALTWLVRELHGLGLTLEAGQFVTTGTCIVPLPVAPGDVVTGDYGDFGSMQVRFTA